MAPMRRRRAQAEFSMTNGIAMRLPTITIAGFSNPSRWEPTRSCGMNDLHLLFQRVCAWARFSKVVLISRHGNDRMEGDGIDLIMTRHDRQAPTVLDGIAILFLPFFLALGWLAYVGWLLGLPGDLVLVLGMITAASMLGWLLRHRSIDFWDIRWIASPIVTSWMFHTLGWS